VKKFLKSLWPYGPWKLGSRCCICNNNLNATSCEVGNHHIVKHPLFKLDSRYVEQFLLMSSKDILKEDQYGRIEE